MHKYCKGSGSGTMMKRLETGEYVFNPEKERVFIAPVVNEDAEQLRPYVPDDAPRIRTKPITKWDYLQRMEETWGTEAAKVFEENSKIPDLGKKSGNLGKWGA